MAKQEITCDDILRELKAGQYRPIYYLMGEEPYYIVLISDYITDNVLNETEKEFNLTVVYGADVDVATIINAAKRYPMMSERAATQTPGKRLGHCNAAAHYYHIDVFGRTLQDYRNNGVIPYIQLGGKILYRESDIQKILMANYREAYRMKGL
jgi:hypothetical protein